MRTGLIIFLALVAVLSFETSINRSFAAEQEKCDCADPKCKCSPKAIVKPKDDAERASEKRAVMKKVAPQNQ